MSPHRTLFLSISEADKLSTLSSCTSFWLSHILTIDTSSKFQERLVRRNSSIITRELASSTTD